jgi:hypothetical protein
MVKVILSNLLHFSCILVAKIEKNKLFRTCKLTTVLFFTRQFINNVCMRNIYVKYVFGITVDLSVYLNTQER